MLQGLPLPLPLLVLVSNCFSSKTRSADSPLGPPPPILEDNLWKLVQWGLNGLDVLSATQPSDSKH